MTNLVQMNEWPLQQNVFSLSQQQGVEYLPRCDGHLWWISTPEKKAPSYYWKVMLHLFLTKITQLSPLVNKHGSQTNSQQRYSNWLWWDVSHGDSSAFVRCSGFLIFVQFRWAHVSWTTTRWDPKGSSCKELKLCRAEESNLGSWEVSFSIYRGVVGRMVPKRQKEAKSTSGCTQIPLEHIMWIVPCWSTVAMVIRWNLSQKPNRIRKIGISHLRILKMADESSPYFLSFFFSLRQNSQNTKWTQGHNSMAFSAFTMLCDHRPGLVPEVSSPSKKEKCPHYRSFPILCTLSAPSSFCLFGFNYSGHFLRLESFFLSFFF